MALSLRQLCRMFVLADDWQFVVSSINLCFFSVTSCPAGAVTLCGGDLRRIHFFREG